MMDTFAARATLSVGQHDYEIHRLDAVAGAERLPFSLKVLLENLLRNEDGVTVTADDVRALAAWDPAAEPSTEIQYTPARVVLQDFTGVPAVVDLAAMREAMVELGGDPARINPLVPAELVIDHSVVADVFGVADALQRNIELEYERNRERYQFLRWGQGAFDGFKVVPPGTGIVHQVNIEYLARVVFGEAGKDGVLRAHGVVGKFVEFYGSGVAAVPLANRATIGNMSPEYGSTAAIFPIDDETLRYLRFTGRSEEQVALVEAYTKEQGLWHDPSREAAYSEQLSLDLSTVVPSLAGPKRPQDRVDLSKAKDSFRVALRDYTEEGDTTGLDESLEETFPASDPVATGDGDGAVEPAGQPTHHILGRPSSPTTVTLADGSSFELDHGAVTIAAITSCTNTSNPSVMIAAALLAKKAGEAGLERKPWVKTTLAPGSKVVMDYYDRAGLTPYLDKLGFNLVGYGCTTCIGNSGPLIPEVSQAVQEQDLAVVSVLSGNRNFEGRINPDVKMNYLASPPLVVAYALAGTMDLDLLTEPLGTGADGEPVMLADIWPSPMEVEQVVDQALVTEMFSEKYASVFDGDEQWRSLPTPEGDTFAWDDASTYIRRPSFFDGMGADPDPVTDIHGARVLAKLGDSVTTDHISPAGAIKLESPAGEYLVEHGVERRDFNSYGSRRGNHEVMVRGTFGNIRLRNQLAPGTEGGYTRDLLAGGEVTSIYAAAAHYQAEGVPLVVLAGAEYGSGSSRDWAAKGTAMLGVRAVLATSFERIHRSNLIGMGVLPLEFPDGGSADDLGLTGEETFDITGITALDEGTIPSHVQVTVTAPDGSTSSFEAKVRIDTPGEASYYRHGGILRYVLRSLRDA
jgi:aconitate hydratase